MSDTYNPFEKEYQITRKALELISYYNFGVSIETKSDLIVRDIDLFKEINSKADLILKFTITTADDSLSKIIEPGVCVSSKRLEAMKKLLEEGLFVGTLLTPIIPFITDSEENSIDDTFAIFLIEEGKEVPYFAGKISDITKFQ